MSDDLDDFFENDRDFHHAKRAGEGHTKCPECGANLLAHRRDLRHAAETKPSASTKPLLLLDVDGVINDIEMAIHLGMTEQSERDAEADRLEIDVIVSHGFTLAIPRYMPQLVAELADRAEIVWLTTWRERANDEIAQHLGVGPFPALDPDGTSLGIEWKVAAAERLVTEAVAEDREVIWIEDFDGDIPHLSGVTYVDTSERGVLRWSDLPVDVLD